MSGKIRSKGLDDPSIVFDMGEVLIQWRPELLTARLEIPEEDVPTLCRELPERLHTEAESLVRNWWKRPLIPIPGMDGRFLTAIRPICAIA